MPLIQTFAGASARGYCSFGSAFANSFESIDYTTSLSGSSAASFTVFPSTYKSLQIRIYAGFASAASLSFTMNGITATNYNYATLANDTSALVTSSVASSNYVQLFGTAKTVSAGYPLGCIIDIFDYASTSKFKTIRVQSAAPSNTGPGLEIYHGTLRGTSTAITSFTVTSTVNFSAGSSVALYGVN